MLELKKRKTRILLENDLLAFTRYFFELRGEEFVENWHHQLIADALKKVSDGEIRNLLINLPPRYTKTELAVINWIAQQIAINPYCRFMHLSYADDLVLDNSSKTKDLIMLPEYQELWPITLKDDSQSKKKWYTKQGGGLYATAAGGPVTGFGAGSTSREGFQGAIIIDDPLKIDDARSDLKRGDINNRLNNTIKSRRNSRQTPMIIIMQRVHEDDMSGFVLNNGMGEEFHHLKIPALNENNEALWPFKHTVEELQQMKVADPYTFNAQYQQDPIPDAGTFFKREWFKRYDEGDEPHLRKYGASDFAVTEGGGDFTEQGVGGFDKDLDLWITDWWTGQTESDVWVDVLIDLGSNNDTVVWVAEKGVIDKAVGPWLKRRMRERKKFIRVEGISHGNKDKATNSRSFQALASQGKVHIPNTPWGEDLIKQLTQFPNGKHDDKVDVCGLFGKILDQAYGPTIVTDDDKITKRDSYDADDDEEDDWAVA